MRLEVSIGGSKRQPLIEGSSLQFGVDQKAATASLRWYSVDPTEFAIHDTVVIVEPNGPNGPTTYFSGYILSLKASGERLPSGHYIAEARCASKAWLLSAPPALVTAAYQSTDDQDIILAAIAAAGLSGSITADTSTIDTIKTALDAAYQDRNPQEVLDDMAQASGGLWFEDAGTLNYNAEGIAGAAAWNINQDAPNGTSTFRVEQFSVESHWEKPVTTVKVRGLYDGSIDIRATASVGGTPPLTFTRVFESPLIVSQAMADAVAAAIIATQGQAAKSCGFRFLNESDGNVLNYWSAFDNAVWSKNGMDAPVANATTAPDGSAEADRLVENSAGGQHYVQQSSAALSDDTLAVVSVHAKTNGRHATLIGFTKGGAQRLLRINLTTGAVLAAAVELTRYFVEDAGAGWWRIAMEYDVGVGFSTPTAIIMLNDGVTESYTGNGASGIYAWWAYFGHRWPKKTRTLKPNTLLTVTAADHGLAAATMLVRSVRMRQMSHDITEFGCSAGGTKPQQEALLRRIDAGERRQQSLPKVIRGLDFVRASSEYVVSGTSIPNIDNLVDFTLFATVRPDAPLNPSTDYTVASKEGGGPTGMKIWLTSTSINIRRPRVTTNYQWGVAHGMSVGAVYRVVVYSSSIQAPRFWVNGVELTGGSGTVGSGAFGTETNTPFKVGAAWPLSTPDHFEGFIGGVVLYNIALPETTCAKLHNASLTALPFAGNAMLVWVLDEFEDTAVASGTDAIRDRSGNNYHGTPTNTPHGDIVVFGAD